MPFPEPGGRENAAPGPDRLLADLTPAQAQAEPSSGPLRARRPGCRQSQRR